MFKAIGAFLTGLVEPVTNHLTERAKIKGAANERKDELKKLSLESKIETAKSNQTLDVKNGGDPIKWANDVTLILFLLPFGLAFYPPALPHIKAGFTALNEMPDWYKYSLGMMLVSVWGYRNLVTPIVKTITSVWLSKYK